MSSGTSIIHDALKKIGVYSVAQKPQEESITTARDMLNGMIQEWLTQGIDMKVMPLSAPGDELNEPADARNGIIANLAVLCAPDFNAPVSLGLNNEAKRGYRHIKKFYQPVVIPDKVASSTLPRGAGNSTYLQQRTFNGKGGTVK